MTRVQFRDLLRSLSSELDNKAVMDAEINEWINWGQGRVANDILSSGIGIKNLIKIATSTFTALAIAPADVTSFVATITTSGVHGIVADDIIIVQDLPSPFEALNGVWEVVAAPTTSTLTFTINNADIASASPATGWVSLGYCSAETDMMDIAKPIVDLQAKFTTTAALGGDDIAYKKATEKLPAQFEDMNPYSAHNVSFSIATSTEPVFCIDGDSSGDKIIRVYPANVDVAIVKYYMRPAAISSDSTAISIPDEFRDLLLLEVKSKMDFKLQGFQASQISAVNYQKKLQELVQGYQNRTAILKQAREDLTKD